MIFRKLSIVLILALLFVASVLWAAGNNVENAATVPSIAALTVPVKVTSTVFPTVDYDDYTPSVPGKSRYGVRTPLIPSGTERIQPRDELLGLGPTVPTFTEQDVRDAINRTGTRGWVDGVDPNNPPTITSIRFITEQEYRASNHGADNGQPDDTLLCVVELAGSFTMMGPPRVGSETCRRGSIILHAHTGNQLGFTIDCGE